MVKVISVVCLCGQVNVLLLKVGNKLRNETIVKQNNVGQGTLGFQTILSAIKVRTITAIQSHQVQNLDPNWLRTNRMTNKQTDEECYWNPSIVGSKIAHPTP